ncbi:polysaccharide export protein [Erythrobacter sp. LQ02-29]|uniref:polysaccharide biosynthesis/export family protein n=1 Tax=Erythrobacter sp. LQ02-29 TaxID=2920384 RepID=UPI001F4ED67F|nr:polysaccharide biosynthesis/export family protein [Erythrobacter sp. LQ02-29]MCP9223444.1 polysaccharide export protein [Erythrobacter sp. LQ02-29]
MKALTKYIFTVVVAVALVGCATDRTYGGAPGVEVTNLTELPLPSETIRFALHPLDQVEVNVVQDTSVSGTYQVDENGNIDFPYVGLVPASGLTPNQFASSLTSRLSPSFIRNPSVTVRPVTGSEPTISIGGEVAKPGSVPIRSSATLMRAINVAGGTTEYAKKDDVLIFRQVDDQRYIGIYNLEGIQRGNYADPVLAPGDVVMVGDSPARRRFDKFLQYFGLLSTSVILLDRARRISN